MVGRKEKELPAVGTEEKMRVGDQKDGYASRARPLCMGEGMTLCPLPWGGHHLPQALQLHSELGAPLASHSTGEGVQPQRQVLTQSHTVGEGCSLYAHMFGELFSRTVSPGLRERACGTLWYLRWHHFSQRTGGIQVVEPKRKAKLGGKLKAIKVADYDLLGITSLEDFVSI